MCFPGMRSHRGPILTVANWSGQWPGLVGLLNLNGSLVKAGVPFNTLWSEDFKDDYFLTRLQEWIRQGSVTHDMSHVRDLDTQRASRHLRKAPARSLPRNFSSARRSSASSMKVAWACTTPSSTTSC